MPRLIALRVLLVLIGLTLLAGLYPLVASFFNSGDIIPADQMILGIYIPFGVLFLLAARNPSSYRSLIVGFAWSTIGHDAVMVIQGIQGGFHAGLLPLMLIGVVCIALLVLNGTRQTDERAA